MNMSFDDKLKYSEIIRTIDDEEEVENFSEDSDVEVEVDRFFIFNTYIRNS